MRTVPAITSKYKYFGANLAASTRTLAASDVVNNQLPTILGGVSVQVDGKPAYMYFASPGQINVLAPADTGSGPVPVALARSCRGRSLR